MLEIKELIKTFFPYSLPEEQQRLALLCEKDSMDYNARTWRELVVAKEQLMDPRLQLNLVRTLYILQFSNYDGVSGEIMNSLEKWSDEKIEFDFLTERQNQFYQLLYAFWGFLNFEHHHTTRQVFLLASRFLPLAFISHLNVREHVKKNFAYNGAIDILTFDSNMFAASIAVNSSSVGGEPNTSNFKPISAWVKMFKDFSPKSPDEKRKEFAESEALRGLAAKDKDLVLKIVYLFDDLDTGLLWNEVDYLINPLYEPIPPDDRKLLNSDEAYVMRLNQVTDIKRWLLDYEVIVYWLTIRPLSIVKRILEILSEKVDLMNEEQLKLALNFTEALSQKYTEKKLSNLLYYDENDGKFHWNLDL